MKEAKELVVDTCKRVITHYATENSIEEQNINIRVDLQTIKSKPIFGVFNGSNLIKRQTLSEVIKATGGSALSMLLNTYIKKAIRDIFTQSLKELEISDPRRIFVLLYEQHKDGVTFPTIALYKDGKYAMQMKVADMIDTQNPV